MNLDERARRAAASIRDEASQADTDAILERVQGTGSARRWLVPATAAAAALVVVAALVVPQLLDRGRVEIGPDPGVPGPTEPGPTTPTSDGDPDGAEVGTWQRVEAESFALGVDSRMRAVARGSGVTVAVGRSSGGPGIWRQDPQRGPEEGVSWRQVAGDLCGEASCELHDVAAFDDRFVVVGTLDGLPKVWASEDGQTWQRIDLDRSGPSAGETDLTALAAGPGRIVAFGTEGSPETGRRPVVFTSTDGQDWSEAAVDFDQEEAGAAVVDAVHVGDGEVVGVGYVGDGSVLFEEQDGTWVARHLSESDQEFAIITTFVNAMRSGDPGEVFMVGSAHGGQDQDGRVWRSSDGGETWETMDGDLGGAGDQQVTDLINVGGSWIAVGSTNDDPGSTAARPAAWMLTEDGWGPMDGGEAFADAGAIQAAVQTDGHSAIAVGTAGGGGDPNEGAAPADAAVWTYTVSEGPAGSDGTSAAGECSAAAAPDEPTLQPDLPDPVADTRQAIHEAASSCDLGTLEDLALDGPRGFTYSFGGGDDPAAYWRRAEEGGRPLLLLTQVLDLPHATVETQFVADEYETVYVWPSAFGDDASGEDWQAVIDAGLVTEDEARQMQQGEGYVGHRAGITADGEWVFFVAGD